MNLGMKVWSSVMIYCDMWVQIVLNKQIYSSLCMFWLFIHFTTCTEALIITDEICEIWSTKREPSPFKPSRGRSGEPPMGHTRMTVLFRLRSHSLLKEGRIYLGSRAWRELQGVAPTDTYICLTLQSYNPWSHPLSPSRVGRIPD